ncbi:MAG: 16S rRNA processing protein RimM [Gammaproteobacteria bacterium]|nr:16S rRNA processing protein RimM [Gammaproteobacteria bacterium]
MYVELGKIVGVWGVKGWVKLHSYTRNRGDIADYANWWLQKEVPDRKLSVYDDPTDNPRKVEVLDCREQGPGVVAQLNGITDREQAMALNGLRILVRETDLPALPNGEFYWQQLIGLAVSDTRDSKIGQIVSIIETGANDVLVIKSDDPEYDEILVPYTDAVVKEVDITQGTMTVDWDPSYLLD